MIIVMSSGFDFDDFVVHDNVLRILWLPLNANQQAGISVKVLRIINAQLT